MRTWNRLFAVLALLVVAMWLAAAPTGIGGMRAQDADAPDDGEEKPAKPEGLNPDRALPGQEPTWWKSPERPTMDVKETVLENGMRVLILKHGHAPVVATNLWYSVGSFHEPAGMTGVAHYLEHMMFKGGEKFGKGQIDDVTTTLGGSNNASTFYDYTNYYFRLPASSWTVALDIELDRMTKVELNQVEFDAEKQVVQEESNTAYDSPDQRMWEDIMRALFGEEHPYSHPVLGYPIDITNMSVAGMRAFHEEWYAPENATLVIVGAVEPAVALAEVKKRFASVPRGRFAGRTPTAIRNPARAQRRITRFAPTGVANLSVVFPSDSARSIRGPCRDVLATVLAGGESSRLFKRLVQDEKLCSSVSAYDFALRRGGVFSIDAKMMPGKSAQDRAKVETIIREEFEKLGKELPDAAEVRRAIVAQEVSHAFSLESVSGLADSIGEAHLYAGDWRHIDRWLETLRHVTPEDVMQVANDWRWDREAVVAWLLPNDRDAFKADAPPSPDVQPLTVRREVLDNGLTIVMLPSTSGPEVFNLSARFEAGVRTESPTDHGLSALFGATLGTGTKNLDRTGLNEVFDKNGGAFNAGSRGTDASVLSRDFGDAIDVTADVLLSASFPDTEVENEKLKLVARIAELKDNHASLASRALARAIYGADHPLGLLGVTSSDAVNAITPDRLRAHHQSFVAPNNTRIIVTGRFDADVVLERLKEKLGAWKSNDASSFRRTVDVAINARSGTQHFTHLDFSEQSLDTSKATYAIEHAEKSQCNLWIGRLGIARDNPDYYACLVLDNILGTSPAFSDRFSRVLRDEMGLAYSVWANLSQTSSEERGMFRGYLACRPEFVPTALIGMRKLIRQIQEEPVSDEELSRAHSYVITSTLLGLESSSDMAGLIDTIERYQLGYDYLGTFAQQVASVTKDDVLRCAKKYLGPEGLVTVVAGPIGKAEGLKQFLDGWNAGTDNFPPGYAPVQTEAEPESAPKAPPKPESAPSQ